MSTDTMYKIVIEIPNQLLTFESEEVNDREYALETAKWIHSKLATPDNDLIVSVVEVGYRILIAEYTTPTN